MGVILDELRGGLCIILQLVLEKQFLPVRILTMKTTKEEPPPAPSHLQSGMRPWEHVALLAVAIPPFHQRSQIPPESRCSGPQYGWAVSAGQARRLKASSR